MNNFNMVSIEWYHVNMISSNPVIIFFRTLFTSDRHVARVEVCNARGVVVYNPIASSAYVPSCRPIVSFARARLHRLLTPGVVAFCAGVRSLRSFVVNIVGSRGQHRRLAWSTSSIVIFVFFRKRNSDAKPTELKIIMK